MSLKGKYFKLLAAIFICILSVSSFCNIPAAAKSSSKVYPAYDFNGDAGKFPKKLPNGLTIGKEKWGGYSYVPTILKGKKKVWSAAKQSIIDGGGQTQFTVTSHRDTFLSYYSGATGGEMTALVGVHQNGKVFFKKRFVSGAGLEVKFLASNKVKVAIERVKKNWDPSREPNAARHSGIWDVKEYTISTTGHISLVKKYIKHGL